MTTEFSDTPVRPAKKMRITGGVEYSTSASGETILCVTEEHVDDEAFAWNEEVVVLVLARSVKSVGYGAFHRMPNVREIDASHAIDVKLGQYCFSQLPKLESVKLGMVNVPVKCFYECRALKKVYFQGNCGSDEVLTMGEYAFAYCGALEEVNRMPPGMVCGKYAFEECKSLEGAFMVGGPNQENVPEGIFYECEKITKLVVQEGTLEVGEDMCNGCRRLGEVELPQSLMVINDKAFLGCRSVKRVFLGENMRVVGREAFRSCEALEEVVNRATERVDFRPMAFAYCTALKSFAVPEKTEELARGMFYECTALESVTLNPALVNVEEECFYGCEKLSLCDFSVATELRELGEGCFQNTALIEIDLCGTKVRTIGFRAFAYINSLTTLTLPETLEVIGELMCGYCTSLKEVRIPAGVTEIPLSCFSRCYYLEEVEIMGDEVEIKKDAFFMCDSIRKAIVGKKNTIWNLIK